MHTDAYRKNFLAEGARTEEYTRRMNEAVSPGLWVTASRPTELDCWDEEMGSSSISNRNTVPEDEAFQMS